MRVISGGHWRKSDRECDKYATVGRKRVDDFASLTFG